jgi:arylsulfatase A-like enzyme
MSGITRRDFMSLSAGAVVAGSLAYPSNAKGQAKADVPNVIFIHVDQMSLLDSISAYGAKYVSTPAIDRIVKNGTSFMQSYSSDPVCCPARAGWWTSTYSSENGIVVNNTPCHSDIPDLSLILQEAGYNTYFTGKWHVPGKIVRKLFHVLHGGSWWGEITDTEVTRSARSFLRNYNDDKPFFLTVGYLNPHDICITPSSEFQRAVEIDGKKVPRYISEGILDDKEIPPLPEAHQYDKREPTIHVATHRGNIDNPKFSQWSDELWCMHRYNYHRFVEMVDREIGLLLDELEHSQWRNNTVLIFSSDHGEGIGRHLILGKSTFYDEVVKVPFIIASPGDILPVRKDVKDTRHLVSGIDLGATVCDYCGADASKLPHGRSLKPLAAGEKVDWRQYVYAESSVYMHMVTDGRYKYVCGYDEDGEVSGLPAGADTHSIGVEQLFDLSNDGSEQRNLAYDGEYQDLIKKMRSVMRVKEAGRINVRKITADTGLNFMKSHTEMIRKREYPKTYPVS